MPPGARVVIIISTGVHGPGARCSLHRLITCARACASSRPPARWAGWDQLLCRLRKAPEEKEGGGGRVRSSARADSFFFDADADADHGWPPTLTHSARTAGVAWWCSGPARGSGTGEIRTEFSSGWRRGRRRHTIQMGGAHVQGGRGAWEEREKERREGGGDAKAGACTRAVS